MSLKGPLGSFSGWDRENGLQFPCCFARSRSRLLALRDRSRLVLEQMSAEYLGKTERRGGSTGQEEYLGQENYACVRQALREWLWKVRDAWGILSSLLTRAPQSTHPWMKLGSGGVERKGGGGSGPLPIRTTWYSPEPCKARRRLIHLPLRDI